MPMEPRFRTDVAHVLLIASDLARTSRGGLSDACMATFGWDLYRPCRRVLDFLEQQIGYEVWSAWGDEPDPRRPHAMTYADALLEASALALDHWKEIADSVRMESTEIRRLRAEFNELRGMVEDLPFQDDQNYYTGVFA